ncbi:sensor histidine kinase [Pseudobacteriovorax antillogorgiicola]|uniref:Signal transduction histidine kinase n=1 Tax=Pseudobacteriovorax antillogorgiicola TaxID=1513793 RepID=A0A1Y6CMH1_9BACT|nr:hypothetical protein [Pseudobacteriovorax antillogorgiicola]TCS45026.1 signal transduction histidine kinase [Pseudobacteriovorax antillogorgiicola]SMF76224.1 Signal transduction histidine kinase [Pseudobacteriovorax antillogorgiicola]
MLHSQSLKELHRQVDLFAQDQRYKSWFCKTVNHVFVNPLAAGVIGIFALVYGALRLSAPNGLPSLIPMGLVFLSLIPPYTKLGRGFIGVLPFSYFSVQRFILMAGFAFDLIYYTPNALSHTITPPLCISLIWSTGLSHSWARAIERNSLETAFFATVYGYTYQFIAMDFGVLALTLFFGLGLSFLLQFGFKLGFYVMHHQDSQASRDPNRVKSLEALIRSLAHSLGGFTMTIDLIAFRNLNSPDLPQELKEEWQDIQRSIQELNAVVRDIRTIQKISAGESEVQKEHVSLHEVFEDLYELFSPRALRKNLSIHSNISSASNSWVWANKQVLVENICSALIAKLIERSREWDNLIINAYNSESESALCLTTEECAPDDSGIKAFLQEDVERPGLENTGGILYLSIVDIFARQVGGHFFVISPQDGSRTFAYVLIFQNINQIELKKLKRQAS